MPLMIPLCEPRFFLGDIATAGPNSSVEGWDPCDELDVDGNLFWFGPEPQISLLSIACPLREWRTFTTRKNEAQIEM